MHGQRCEIRIGLYHLLRRRRLHLHKRLRRAEAGKHIGEQPVSGGAEGERKARAAPSHVRRQLGAAGVGEPHRLPIAVVHGGDVAERDRLVDALQFGRGQRLQETAQAEALEVHQTETVSAS